MDIHEYQAKELLAGFGVAIPRGGVAYSPEQAVYRASEIGGARWAVKAQIHSGARGKAGGIKLCSNEDEVRQAAKALLGSSFRVSRQRGVTFDKFLADMRSWKAGLRSRAASSSMP